MRRYVEHHVGGRRRAREFLDSVLRPLALVLMALFSGVGCAVDDAPTDARIQGWLFDTG